MLLGCVVGSWGLVGCAQEAGSSGDSGWVSAAEAVRPAVQSVWGRRQIPGTDRTVIAPLGSAVVLTADGALLTNAHVVVGPGPELRQNLRVLVQGDSGVAFHDAVVAGVDQDMDLAVVRIAARGLPTVRWTLEGAPMGTPLATIGYGLPEGGVIETSDSAVVSRFTLFRRFTAGYSSGYRMRVPGDVSSNLLEADLFLFPGVSGGPAFRLDGRVVGIDRGYREYRETASSYGMIIPANVVLLFLREVAGDAGLEPDSILASRSTGG